MSNLSLKSEILGLSKFFTRDIYRNILYYHYNIGFIILFSFNKNKLLNLTIKVLTIYILLSIILF